MKRTILPTLLTTFFEAIARLLIRVLVVVLAGTGGAMAQAQAVIEVPRIAMVLWRGETEVERGFRAALAESGVAAKIDVFNVDRDLTRLPDILRTLRAAPPDLVYTWGTGVTLGVAGAWDTATPEAFLRGVPMVFVMVAAPYETRVAPPVQEPARPDLTGVSHIAPLAAQINAIRSYFPLQRLGVVFNPAEANSVSNVHALRTQAARQGFTLLEAPVPLASDGQPSPDSIPGLVTELAEKGAQVLYIGPDNFIGNHRHVLTDAGIAQGVPSFSATELEIRDGEAMFGLVSRYEQVGRLAAAKVRAILVDRTPVSEIPVETLERFAYLIRLPVARKLGRYPPLSLLRYAEIIE